MDNQNSSPRSRASRPLTVLVVGQIPPPINGQSLMIKQFLDGSYTSIRLRHLPMTFSRTTDEIGNFGVRKLFHLVQLIAAIVGTRLSSRASVLYYPPAGANLNPVMRDMAILILTRWMFRFTAFHFHAAGLRNIYGSLSVPLRWLFRLAYQRPDLAIFTTQLTSSDGRFLKAKAISIVPCGIPDGASVPSPHKPSHNGEAPRILFAGILCEGKGVLVLLEACRMLREKKISFSLSCLGAFQSADFEAQVRSFLCLHDLEFQVSFPGVLTGEAKHQAFTQADVFCFPSHYPAESFGVVLIEAMSYSLPILATRWQGIPEVVGRNGGTRLIAPRDPVALMEELEVLLASRRYREQLGQLNRERYLSFYTLKQYRANLERSLRALGTGKRQEDLSKVVFRSFWLEGDEPHP